MKSLFSGALLGLLTGGVVAGAASVIAPQPAGNSPPAAPLIEAPSAAADTPEAVQSQPDVAEVAQTTTSPDAPTGLDVETPSVLPDTDTTPPDVPAASDVATGLEVPAESDAPEVVASGEEPVLPNPQSVAPQVPVAEDDLVVSTTPAAEPVEVVEELPVEETPVEDVPAEDAPVEVVVVDEAAPVEEEVAVEADPELPGPPPAPVIVSDAPTDVQVPDAQDTDVAEVADEADAPPTEDAPALETPAASDVGPVIVDVNDAPEEDAQPVVISLNDDTSGSRLPQGVSDIPVNRATGSDDAAAEPSAVEPTPIDPDSPAMDQFAVTFENPDDKPTMAVILVDDGSLADSAAALADVPFPVTVVLDPTAPNVAEAMAAYRAAGLEVAVLAALPEGARPSDVEVSFAAAFGALPETVALVDPGQGNLQGDRAVMAQAMANLAEDGRGLITVSRGLNTGVQAAEDAGVPTGLIFRDLDSEDQDARVVGRFLDQAAFRARQEPGVILLGRVRAETLDALSKWGRDNRAGQVAMAPVSAILATE